MEDKRKAVKTSMQGTIVIAIFLMIFGAFSIYNADNLLVYLKSDWDNILFFIGIAVSLVFYFNKKYEIGAKLIIFISVASMLGSFVSIILTYNSFTVGITTIIISFILAIIVPLILIYEAVRVLRASKK